MATAIAMSGTYRGNLSEIGLAVAGGAARVLGWCRMAGPENKQRKNLSMSMIESQLPSGKNFRIEAPFTPQEINKLEWWQANMHPYTCPNRGNAGHPKDSDLIPKEEGFVCLYCDYAQAWAHFVTI